MQLLCRPKRMRKKVISSGSKVERGFFRVRVPFLPLDLLSHRSSLFGCAFFGRLAIRVCSFLADGSVPDSVSSPAVWPEKVLNGFRAALAQPGSATNEAHFHGCWNKLLHTVFAPDSDYEVTPQLLGQRSSDGAQAGAFVVHLHGRPVMFVELRAPCRLESPAGRADAVEGMRERFRALAGALEVPVLVGASAFGTRLAFYELDGAARIIRSLRVPSETDDIDGGERWKWDVLEEVGYEAVMAVVGMVKEMCAAQYGV
jgi:hypothetical protein